MIAGMAVVKGIWKEIKQASVKLFEGEVTISKRECWLIGAVLLLAGIALGFIHAPLTHGVNISLMSNNGNDNGHNVGNGSGNDSLDQDGANKIDGAEAVDKKSGKRTRKGA
ncbi:MAG: hypothetical protein NC419_04680 [Muribaculaceae bacterium]|nr:hypothetical protein [Muribaculaceae bacterium]